jgi:Mg-chelatase subunit ChlD
MANKKGIELVKKSDSPSKVSITIGNTTLKPQGHPVTVRFEKQTAYVYLMIDTSGSMADAKLEQAKKGALDFAKDAFRKEYAVGLISFSTQAKHICKPTFDIEVLKNSISEINAIGTTNMADAINMAHEHFNALKNTRVMVIATDGLPDNAQEALKEATKAKQDGIDIITIGTDDADQQFLKTLATRSELGNKVSSTVFSQAISSASNLLPPPKSIIRK